MVAAAATALFASLFRLIPSTQRQDEEDQIPIPQNFTEVELLPYLTTEAILTTGITWDKLRRFLKSKIVRMSLGVYVCPKSFRPVGYDPILVLGAPDDSTGLSVRVKSGTAIETAMAACDFLVRLLAASEKPKVYLYGHSGMLLLPVSGPTLSHLFERGRESLIKVTVGHVILNEEHIRALAIEPRQELELALVWCKFSDNDACRNACAQWLQSDGGPTEIDGCHIDSHVLADSLKRENSRLGVLHLPSVRARRIVFGCVVSNDPKRTLIYRALAENRGLTAFNASGHFIGHENWSILCQSIQTHPTLIRLNLTETGLTSASGEICALLSDAHRKRRTRELGEMMQKNTILCTINLIAGEYDKRIYKELIQPRLEVNLYTLRVRAVKKEADRTFRQKVLGRSLSRVRRNPNLVWMFLSENVDAFIRAEEQAGRNSSQMAVVVAVPDAEVDSKRKRC